MWGLKTKGQDDMVMPETRLLLWGRDGGKVRKQGIKGEKDVGRDRPPRGGLRDGSQEPSRRQRRASRGRVWLVLGYYRWGRCQIRRDSRCHGEP